MRCVCGCCDGSVCNAVQPAAKSPAEAVAEARENLWKMSRELFHDEQYANATIDAFAAAVRAEAFEEMWELATNTIGDDDDPYGLGRNDTLHGIGKWAKQQAEKARQE